MVSSFTVRRLSGGKCLSGCDWFMMGAAPDRARLPERCLVLITEPLLKAPAVSPVCVYFSMLVSMFRRAKEQLEKEHIQYLAVVSPGIQCTGWIQSPKLVTDALEPFLHEAERQASVSPSHATKENNNFCQTSQREELLDRSHFLPPSAGSMSAPLPVHPAGSAAEHAQKALRSQNSLVQRICSELHYLGDSLPLGSSSGIYLDVILAVPPQCVAPYSCLCYSPTDPRSLGLYAVLRHLIMKTEGLGGCCITFAEVRVNGISDTETVMNPVWIPWCSLLPARLVQLGSNIRHLPLERHIAWRGRLLAGSRKDIKSLGNFSICTSGSNVSTFIEPRGDLTLVRLVPWSKIMGSCHLLKEGLSVSVFPSDMKAKGCVERLRVTGGGGLAAVVIMSKCRLAMAWRFDEQVGCVVAQFFISPDDISREASLCLLEKHGQNYYSKVNMDKALQAILSLPILGETEACHTTTPTSDASTVFSSPLTVDNLYETGTPLQAELGMYGIPGVGGLQSPEFSCLHSVPCDITEVSSHQVVDSGVLGEESSLDAMNTENAIKRTRSGSVATLLRPSSSQVGGRSGSSLQKSASLPHKIRSSLLSGAGKRKRGKAVVP